MIHPETGEVRTFVVGAGVERGERVGWVVEGGWWKCSFIEEGEELLVSEVVVPGWEEADHEFLG